MIKNYPDEHRLLMSYISKIISENVSSRALTPSIISKYSWRIDRFIEKVKLSDPIKVFDGSGVKDALITLQATNLKNKSAIETDLSDKKFEIAFRTWLVKKDASGWDFKPIINQRLGSWGEIYKDPEAFVFEVPKKSAASNISLRPTDLDIDGKKLTLNKLIALLKIKVKQFDPNLAAILSGLINSAAGDETIPSSLSKKIAELELQDKNKLIVQFGEVLSAIIEAKSMPATTIIEFPSDQGHPLVDFYITGSIKGKKGPVRLGYSAKGLGGSGSSLKNFASSIKKLSDTKAQKLDEYEKEIASAFTLAASAGSLHETVLVFAQNPAVKNSLLLVDNILGKIRAALGIKTLTSQNILDAVKSDPNKIIKFYKSKVGVLPKTDLKELIKGRMTDDTYKSLIIYPLLKSILTELNNEKWGEPYRRVVAYAVNELNATQIKLNFDNMKLPTRLVVDRVDFNFVHPDGIRFTAKASSTSFGSGGLGIKIDS